MLRSDKDFQVWEQWKKNPTDANMQAVLTQLNPIIQMEVNRWAGTLARPALELEAKTLAAAAIRSYDPNRGAALGTHITNQLRKLSRLPYTHQNLARVPEYQTLKFHTYNMADSALKDKLGRDPTVDELSSQLGWSKSYLNNFQKTIRKEYVESGETPPIFDTDSGESGIVDFVYNDLSPMQKTIFEHTTGYGGAKPLKNPQLMKKLKLSQGQLSYQKRLLVDKIKDVTGGGIA
jgi:DNA-directed RNA polymerase specialized sigma subunit